MVMLYEQEKSLFARYDSFWYNDNIISNSFKNSDNFSDSLKKEIFKYLKHLFDIGADIFLIISDLFLKYRVNVSFQTEWPNQINFLISR